MKSRQVGFVLMALIAVGIAGLIVRVVSSGSNELVLSGLLPLSQDVVDRVTISSGEKEAELIRIGGTWSVRRTPVFPPKLASLWTAVSDIDGAQLIATNPNNHERMGVADGQGTVVSFYLGPSIQEQFIVGKWTDEVRLCYLRRSGTKEVHGIPCPLANVFDPDSDGWRNPVVAAIPRDEVESLTFTYPDEEFVLTISDGDWVVASDGEERSADLRQVDIVLTTIERLLLASGFADDEARELDFDSPDASVRIVTRQGASSPTTRLRFLERDDISYYVNTPAQSTVFILDKRIADGLLKAEEELVFETGP